MSAKRIYRNQRDKVICGVCAGIAEYFDIDVAWVRLGFVLGAFLDGVGVLAYLIAWVVFPKDERSSKQVSTEKDEAEDVEKKSSKSNRWEGVSSGSRNALGVVLVLLGVLFFLDQNFYWFGFDTFWPVLLIGLGVFLLVRATEPETSDTPGTYTVSTVATPAPAADAATPAPAADTASDQSLKSDEENK